MKKRADARRDGGRKQGLTEEKEKGFTRNPNSYQKFYKIKS
jgi:hypothetical protein